MKFLKIICQFRLTQKFLLLNYFQTVDLLTLDIVKKKVSNGVEDF